jgi:hypothetical protein
MEFRQYILTITPTKLNEALGINLKTTDFSVHLSGFSPAVDMYNVLVEGAPPLSRAATAASRTLECPGLHHRVRTASRLKEVRPRFDLWDAVPGLCAQGIDVFGVPVLAAGQP